MLADASGGFPALDHLDCSSVGRHWRGRVHGHAGAALSPSQASIPERGARTSVRAAFGHARGVRSLAVAATHSADHARTGLRCASCSDDCGGTTRSIDGRAPSPIPLTCTGDWSFWRRMYSGGGRRIALSNDARPGREDEKRAQMSTRAERSACLRGRGDIPAAYEGTQTPYGDVGLVWVRQGRRTHPDEARTTWLSE
jgi:hypothetical protein